MAHLNVHCKEFYEENCVNLATRLREERERMHLTQAAIAELVGVSARSQQDWERGLTVPNATYLISIAALGIDVQYVLTGIRILDPALHAAWQQSALFAIGTGMNANVAESIARAYEQTSTSLSQEELNLISLFRRCSPAVRTSILEWAAERASPALTPPLIPVKAVERQAPASVAKSVRGSRPTVHQDFSNAQIGQVAGDIHAPQTFNFTGKNSPESPASKGRKGKN